MVIYPYNVDQPFWAKQCYRLGICPKPILFNRLNSKNLSIAIEEVIKNESYSKKAIELGKKINLEDIFERYFFFDFITTTFLFIKYPIFSVK